MFAEVVLLGADSLVVGLAVALVMRGTAARLTLAVACGLADGIASGLVELGAAGARRSDAGPSSSGTAPRCRQGLR